MKNYLAQWGNGTITVLSASDDENLYLKLFSEGVVDDEGIVIYKLPGDFHVTTKIEDGKIAPGTIHGLKPKRFKFAVKSLKEYQKKWPCPPLVL